jgi:glutaredoxin
MSYLIMTKPGCNYCTRAKALLKSQNIPFSVVDHDTPEKIERFKANGYTSFPQIFHDGVLVGGHDDLVDYLEY